MIQEKLKEYAERFDDGFPMIPLAWGRTDDEVIAIIDECLEKEQDVYELGILDDAEDGKVY